MNNNLKKLNRKQLLEILLEQTKRIEELEVELQKTKDKLKARVTKPCSCKQRKGGFLRRVVDMERRTG